MLNKFKDLAWVVEADVHYVGATVTHIDWVTPSGVEYDLYTDWLETFEDRVLVIRSKDKTVGVFMPNDSHAVYAFIMDHYK